MKMDTTVKTLNTMTEEQFRSGGNFLMGWVFGHYDSCMSKDETCTLCQTALAALDFVGERK